MNWRSISTKPKIGRGLNSAKIHFCSKFGNRNFNWWWVMAWTSSNGVNFDFEVKFDLEGQGQSPPKTIEILTKVFYIYGPNLVILTDGRWVIAGTSSWLTHGRTDTQTDAGNDNTQRLKLTSGKNMNKANLRDLIAATGLVILLKLDSNRRFFRPCDLELWLMTSKYNRAPFIYYWHQALCIISKPSVNSILSYSPKTLDSGQNRRFFVWWDLEIWWLTLKNNKAPLLCCFKLCASFQSHL